jgi:hypothetical protein
LSLPKAARRANFPVCPVEADFKQWARAWKKAGGTAEVIQSVRNQQPFLAPPDLNGEDYVLRIVVRLNNTDKHRLLNLTPIGLSDEKPPNLKILFHCAGRELRVGADAGAARRS